MNIIAGSIRFPHTVIVVTLLIVMFGVISMRRVPLQMRPSIDKPEITITTLYAGAAPQVLEDKVTRPIEELLNSVEGLKKMTSTSSRGRSRITLEFDWYVNRDAAMVDVLNKLGRVQGLPEEAERPVAEAISSDTSSPIMWVGFQGTNDEASKQVNRMRMVVDDLVEPRLRRVSGVGSLIITGGQEREVQIVVDLTKIAELRISLSQLVGVLQKSNQTIRGGPLYSGKREYTVWTTGRAALLSTIRSLVVRRGKEGVVTVGDIAEVKRGFKKRETIMRLNGKNGIAVGVLRKTGANVPQTAKAAMAMIKSLNREMAQKGLPYKMRVLFTETTYIDQAVGLVNSNILIGAALAVAVLLLFLGSVRSVLVIGISIPVSVIAVFIMIDIFGRSMNIVSLAGLAFAVGMVVDNAIVVLENIYRYLEKEEWTLAQICYHGTKEVALAVGASTLTTVAVFLPIVFLQTEAGQIFKDIALAISFAVGFSFIFSLTLIPMLCRLLLKKRAPRADRSGGFSVQRLVESAGGLLDRLYRVVIKGLIGAGKGPRRIAVLMLVLALFIFSLTLVPPVNYLPSGTRNLIITLARPLPGTSLEKTADAARPLERWLLSQKEVQRTFTIFATRFNAIGSVLRDDYSDEKTLQRFLGDVRRVSSQVPGFLFMFPIKASIFRNPGKQFEVEVTGPDMTRIAAFAQILEGGLRGIPGVISVRSDYEAGALSLEVFPRSEALIEKNVFTTELADAVQVALGGLRVGYFLDQGRELDLTLVGDEDWFDYPSVLREIPFSNATGKIFYLDDIGSVVENQSPTQVNRINMNRAITLTVNLDKSASLGRAMQRVEAQLFQPLRASMPSDYSVTLGETADKLNETLHDLSNAFLLALLISYLLMVALFRSFWYPFIIMFTVPMAATGAFLAIGVMGAPFDTITMLGFIILAGVVVNNAILIVHQTLNLQREGSSVDEALIEGAVSRLRPILMTAITSVLGMLPLALGSGAGTELYRGLGIAMVGGLSVSTFVTLFMVPALLGIVQDVKFHLFGVLPRAQAAAEEVGV